MVEKILINATYFKDIYDSFIKVERNGDFYNLPGIYLIKNNITGDIYIGQSKSVGYRLTTHRSQLRANKHFYSNNAYDIMQKSWNKYGESAFSFWIVVFADLEKLDYLERYWIAYFNCNRSKSGFGFNLNDGGNKPPHGSFNKGRIHLASPDGKTSVSVPAEELEEYIAKGYTKGYVNQKLISQKAVQTKKLLGTNISGMHNKVKISNNSTTMFINKKDINEYLADGWYLAALKYNRHGQTAESIAKSAKAKWKALLQIDLNGNIIAEFESAKAASIATGISRSYICRMCKNKFKNNKYSFSFRYK